MIEIEIENGVLGEHLSKSFAMLPAVLLLHGLIYAADNCTNAVQGLFLFIGLVFFFWMCWTIDGDGKK